MVQTVVCSLVEEKCLTLYSLAALGYGIKLLMDSTSDSGSKVSITLDSLAALGYSIKLLMDSTSDSGSKVSITLDSLAALGYGIKLPVSYTHLRAHET